jgi:hypothetical protein
MSIEPTPPNDETAKIFINGKPFHVEKPFHFEFTKSNSPFELNSFEKLKAMMIALGAAFVQQPVFPTTSTIYFHPTFFSLPPLLPLVDHMTPEEREAARLRGLVEALTEHFGDTDPRLDQAPSA